MPPANILNLPDYIITRIEETVHDYHVYAEIRNSLRTRIARGGTNVVGYDRNERLIPDLPMHGKRDRSLP